MEALTNSDPARIGPYRLLSKLGAGGMGQVYLARSEGGRTVAVKLVRAELASEPDFRRRFAQEVAAARRVGGEWTAPVLDADTEAAEPWVATGYVPGPTLHEAVARNGRALPESSVRVLANRLAQALAAIHGAGLIHRDLKPGNVLVTIDGPLVIDFGIARALDAVTGTGKLTRTGAVVGSPGFMSPEQVRGESLTAASDVFCLGSVLAFAATARAPFGGGESGMHAVMYRIAQEEPDLGGLPDGLAGLVRACLAKDAAARPSPAEVAALTEDAVPDEDEPWLPAGLIAQLGRHAAQLLEVETPSAPPQPPPLPAGPPSFGPPPAAALPTPALPTPTPPAYTPPPHTPPSHTPRPAPSDSTPPPGFGPALMTPVANQEPARFPAPAPGPAPAQAAPVVPATSISTATTSRKPRRTVLLASAVVLALVVGVGAALAATRFFGDKDPSDGSKDTGGKNTAVDHGSPAPTRSPATGGVPGAAARPPVTGATALPTTTGAVPAGYLGSWQGEVKDSEGKAQSLRRFTIKQGAEGEELINTVNSEDKVLCEGVSTLVSAGNLLELDTKRVAKSIPAEGCTPSGKQTLRLRPDRTIVWTDGEGSRTAVLHKIEPMAKAAVPSALVAAWKRTYKSEDGATHNMVLKISQGTYGEVVLRTTGDGDNYHCEWESSLVDAGSTTLRLAPSVVTATEPKDYCKSGDSHTEILELRGQTLFITQVGGSSDDEPASYRKAD